MGMYDDSNGNSNAWNAYYKTPGDYKMFKVPSEDGWMLLDFLPYTIGGNNHPDVVAGKAQVGDIRFCLSFSVHQKIGPAKKTFLCPKKSYGGGNRGGCPICDARADAYNDGNEALAKALNANDKVLYNVSDPNAPDKGVMLFEASRYQFHDQLMLAAQVSPQKQAGASILDFASPTNGCTVGIYVKHEPKNIDGKTVKVATFSNIQFSARQPARQQQIAALLPKAYPLDLGLIYTSGDELATIRSGAAATAEAPAAIPSSPFAAAAPLPPMPPVQAQVPPPAQPVSIPTTAAAPVTSVPPTVAPTLVCPYKSKSGEPGKFGIDFDEYKFCSSECPIASDCCLANSQRK